MYYVAQATVPGRTVTIRRQPVLWLERTNYLFAVFCLTIALPGGRMGVSAADQTAMPSAPFHWEAESLKAVGSEPEIKFAAGASGGKYAYLPRGQKDAGAVPKSSLTARFDAPAGRYLARVRAFGVNGSSDSLFVGADGQNPRSVGVKTLGEWVWLETPVQLANDGAHTLVVAAREPARVDVVELVPQATDEISGAVAMRQSIPVVPEPNAWRGPDINPPTFRWVGGWDKPHTLHLARADTAWEQAQEIKNITETFYRPLEPLATGAWKWRVKAEGEPWLPAQTFAIKENTTRWPLPEWESLFRRFSREHPRLLCGKADLPGLREKINGPMRDLAVRWTDDLKKKIGVKLSLEEDKVSEKKSDRKAATIQRTSSKKDAGDLMQPVECLALLAVVMNRDEFAQEAIRRALAAAQLDPKGYTSHEISDFANGAIVRNVAEVYDLLYDRLTPEQRQTLRVCLRARVLDAYKPRLEQRLYSAHGWQHVFFDLCHGALALWDEDAEMANWLRWALKLTAATYPWYGGADGASEEGGGYFSGTDLMSSLRMARFWKNACGLDLAGNPWFRNDPWYVIYSCPVSGPVSRFGDHSPEKEMPTPTRAMAAMIQADRYGNPFAAAYAQAIIQRREPEHFTKFGPGNATFAVDWLLEGPFGRTQPKPLTELPPGHVFPETGLAFIHNALHDANRNVMFEFRASPYGAFNHAHADQNSFNLSACGDELIVDAGHYTSFGDEHHYGYTVKQKAHNLILVDGKDEPSRELAAYGRIIGFGQGKDWAWVMGDAKTAYFKTPLERYNRQCIWLRGADTQTYVIFDSIAAKDGKPHRFDWLLHSLNQPALDDPAQKAKLTTPKAQAQVTWLWPAGLKYSLSDQFDPPAQNWRPDRQKLQFPNQWHLTATPMTSAANQTFLTVIQAGPKDGNPAPAPVRESATAVRIGEWQLNFTDDSVQISRASQPVFTGKAGNL
jgi:hypothetical protein